MIVREKEAEEIKSATAYGNRPKQDVAEATACARNSLRKPVTRAWRRLVPKIMPQCNRILSLGMRAEPATLLGFLRKEIAMVRELHLLTVGFVFAFLGAIVMGVF